jgi:hypothetical protein
MDEVQRFGLRVNLIQPIKRIHLDAVHPDVPVQMRARYTPSTAYPPDNLTLTHEITNVDKDL